MGGDNVMKRLVLQIIMNSVDTIIFILPLIFKNVLRFKLDLLSNFQTFDHFKGLVFRDTRDFTSGEGVYCGLFYIISGIVGLVLW